MAIAMPAATSTGQPLNLSFGPEEVHVLTPVPALCQECRELHYFFINRNGKTRCWECDLRERGTHDGRTGCTAPGSNLARSD